MVVLNIRVPCSTQAEIQHALDFLAQVAERQYRQHPEWRTDAVGAGVRYQREPYGQEEWLSPLELRQLKRGDCEDFAADRTGYLRSRGIAAKANVRPSLSGEGFHCNVISRGRVQDPSREAGMR